MCFDNSITNNSYASFSGTCITHGDINNDGDIDIVGGTYSGIMLLNNNGNDSFPSSFIFLSGVSIEGIALGDVDGDSQLDIVASSSTKVLVLINLGFGNFSTPTNYTLGTGFKNVQIKDLNNDSKPDITVGNPSGQFFSVLLNNGTGLFSAPINYQTYPNSTPFSEYTVEDLNNDGFNDTIFANRGDSLCILTNAGNGTFLAPVFYGFNKPLYDVESSDLNSDGIKDIAFISTDSLFVMLGLGGGSFGPTAGYRTDSSSVSLSIGDVSGDNVLDIVVVNSLKHSFSLFFNTGSGILNTAVNYQEDPGSGGASLSIADFNGDSKNDMAFYSWGFGVLGIIHNNGSGIFTSLHLNITIGGIIRPFIADFNNDGFDDFLALTLSGILNLGVNDGLGYFLPIKHFNLGFVGLYGAVADVNNDGFQDVLAIESQGQANRVGVLINNGILGFAQINYTVGYDPIGLETKDIDSDGDIDIIVTSSTSKSISVLLNNGNGIFASAVITPLGNTPSLPAELMHFSSQNTWDLSQKYNGIYSYSGGGLFSLITTNMPGENIGDVDNDGLNDLIAPSYNGDNTGIIYFSTGLNSFTSTTYTLGSSVTSMPYRSWVVEDLNGDNLKDIVLGDLLQNDIYIMYKNSGFGYSQPVNYLSGLTGTDLLAIGDFTGDGKPEIVIYDGKLRFFVNQGGGIFLLNSTQYDGLGLSLLMTDFNHDTRLDILQTTGNNVIVYYNGSGSIVASPGSCSGNSVILNTSSGLNCVWSPGGSTADSLVVTSNGIYSVTVTNQSHTCKSTNSFSVTVGSCVWPGDADESLLVDNLDLLPIGIKSGVSGFPRTTQSNIWQGNYGNNWNDTLSSGVNTKFTDCDGSGLINMNDTLAINLNYGLNHPARYGAPQIIQTLNPDLFLTFNKTLYYPGDTVLASVNVGSFTNVQNNFYGTAFTINYDNSKVKSGSEQFYFNNSWVGNINQSKIKLSKIFASAGQVDASLVRITHTDTSGFGKVATLRFILRDTLNANELYFTINNGIKTDHNGTYSSLNAGTDSVSIVQGIGVHQFSERKQLSLFPNPATNSISINSPNELGSISIYNSLGEIVLQTKSKNKQEQIDVSRLSQGVYVVFAAGKYLKFIKE